MKGRSDLISEQDFHLICAAADSILEQSHQAPEILSFPWLHVLRAHPQYFPPYEDLSVSDEGSANLFKAITANLRMLASIALSLFGAVMSKKRAGLNEIKSDRTDVIVISHLLKPDMLSEDADFYFGRLQKTLRENKINVVTAFLNHSETSTRELSKSLPDNCFFLGSPISLGQEFTILGMLRKVGPFIKNLSQVSDNICRSFGEKMCRELFGGALRKNLRLYLQLTNILSSMQPKLLIFTYEGHAWERLAILAARTCSPETRCVGYMHSALFEYQHAPFRSLGIRCDPDIIAVTGNVPLQILNEKLDNNNWHNVKTIILGSKTSGSTATIKNRKRPSASTCLVIPEGILSECSLLFKYTLECANRYPHIYFIWRLHPLLSYTDVLATDVRFQDLPGNIILSESTLAEDIRLSTWVLYRGSTAVFDAVSAGLRPLYLHRLNELPIDPLYQIDIWKIKLRTINDFENVISEPDVISEIVDDERVRAEKFCQSYRMPLQEQVIMEELL